MQITAIQTDKVLPNTVNIYEFLDRSIQALHEEEIVVITSKIIALCENRVADTAGGVTESLVAQEAEKYISYSLGGRTFYLTITCNTLLLTAGIDSSNGGDHLVLLPKNPQDRANEIRQYLTEHFNVRHVGVIVTDSTSQPLRRGTVGVALAHSGFLGIHDYVGELDIFGKPLRVSKSNIAAGLAAAAVTLMGEGAEQTPLSVISDVPFVTFQDRAPNDEELAALYVKPNDDLFTPLLNSISWKSDKSG